MLDRARILGVWGLRLSNDGLLLAAGTQLDGSSGLRIWDTTTATERLVQDGFASYWVRTLALSDDGRWAASGDERGNLAVWDVARGRPHAHPLRDVLRM